jgi:glycosyltransferase involved in cell wall biosynthesis
MKFLFTAPRFHTNQVPIVKGLIEKGHEVTFFVHFIGATEEHKYGNLVLIKPSYGTLKKHKKLLKTKSESETESAIGGQFVPCFRDLKTKFYECNPDVVICRDCTSFTLAVHELCKKTNTPCILYEQDPLYKLCVSNKKENSVYSSTLLKRVRNKINTLVNKDSRDNKRRINKYGYPIVHITPVLTDNYEKFADFNLKKSHEHNYYFPMVYEADKDTKNERQNSRIKILCVGKYREYKSHRVLVDAIGLLKYKDKMHLDIYGQCKNSDEKIYFKDLSDYISKKHLDDYINLKKDIGYQEMQGLFNQYDILVLPSRRETYGMVIIEAMANGLCVIVSDGCGASFCVSEADGGAVFPVGDYQKLSELLNYYITNPIDIKLKGNNARNYVKQNMSIDNYYNTIKQILNDEFNLQF